MAYPIRISIAGLSPTMNTRLGISEQAIDTALRATFSTAGRVLDVRLSIDGLTNLPRPFAFVQLDSFEDKARASMTLMTISTHVLHNTCSTRHHLTGQRLKQGQDAQFVAL